MTDCIAAAFYKFVELRNYASLKPRLLELCEALGIKGTILLAPEGITGLVRRLRRR